MHTNAKKEISPAKTKRSTDDKYIDGLDGERPGEQ